VACYFLHCCASSVPSRRIEWSGVVVESGGKNLSPNQSGSKREGLYMHLLLPKMGRELGAKVGGINFIPWKSGGNKFSDRCQKFYCIVKKKSGVTLFFYCIEKKKCIGVKRKVESLSFFFSSCQKIYCIEKKKSGVTFFLFLKLSEILLY
jgi:hypothetical protein